MLVTTIDYNIILYIDRLEELIEACRTGDKEKVCTICMMPKYVNAKETINGWTPLMVATYNNQIPIVYTLIGCGADIFAKNYNGTNLLMYAKDAYLQSGNSELFELFVKLGISPDAKDYKGNSLWDYLNEEKTLLEVLESYGYSNI